MPSKPKRTPGGVAPTPWRVKKADPTVRSGFESRLELAEIPCEIVTSMGTSAALGVDVAAVQNYSGSAKANAEFIVKACNHHEQLVAACRFLLRFVPEWARVVPAKMGPQFYGTGTHAGDWAVKVKVDDARALLASLSARPDSGREGAE